MLSDLILRGLVCAVCVHDGSAGHFVLAPNEVCALFRAHALDSGDFESETRACRHGVGSDAHMNRALKVLA